MQTFFFPGGEMLNCDDIRKSAAIGALSPLGTLVFAEGYFERTPSRWVPVADEYAETQMDRFFRRRERAETAEKVKNASKGVSFSLADRLAAR